jgi:hypothetical protein
MAIHAQSHIALMSEQKFHDQTYKKRKMKL